MQKKVARLTPKEILEKDFKTSIRGYSQDEVDQFLDQIIKDYDAFEKRIQVLEKEAEKMQKEASSVSEQTKRHKPLTAPQPQPQQHTNGGNTNYDILRRLSNLEKHVFGSKLNEE
ncbi:MULTISPECIES: cell division regulator GpsB [Alteribacter]|uniref:Cell division regulator GpsB n=1 Tax=Alteribacter keqinensis TaxID=2483800 RepID=A0A3M7TXA1_9BACI|nr:MULTISPECIES: cell division regulator GpsB [Alteribacter]MBM7094366.1 cell division regulator GpsB [Alteribacter salitolerans]RNA69404.1 cell division regulator GpsB [Alteribacter keqinensis]